MVKQKLEAKGIDKIWQDPETLDVLERNRDNKRKGERLSFDCFNLKCHGDRAFCSEGILIADTQDGSLPLLSVLRGMTSSACRKCKVFEGGQL